MENERQFSEQMRTIRWRMTREEFRFANEIRVIPRAAVYLAIALQVAGQVIAITAHAVKPGDPLPLIMLAALGIACAVDVLLLLLVYVNRDAKRRGMNWTLWTLLVILVPYLIGMVVYFLVREPLPYNCPQCGATVSARFNYCPSCQCNLRPACPQCKREVQPDARYCPNCASELATGRPTGGESVNSPAPEATA